MKKKLPSVPVQKNECYEAAVTGLTQEGNGVVKVDGFSVFVPQTAIGDRIRFRVVKVLSSYGFGRLEEVLVPSSDRVENTCPVYRQCGGCVFRHLSYEAECAAKQQLVEDSFRRLGKIDLSPMPIVGSPRVDHYRNKAQFPFGTNADGQPILGFFAARSHRIISCLDCALQPTVFSEIAEAVLTFVRTHHISIYNESTGKGILRHLYLRMASATGEVMVCLVGAAAKCPHGDALVEMLQHRFPQVTSIYYNENKRRDNVILGQTCTLLAGKPVIKDVLCGVKVDISPLSFYQVNHDQAEALYRKAMEFAELSSTDVLLDLYCGIGTIGLTAAHRVRQLIGVEVVEAAVEDARKNAAKNGFTNTRFLCADCKEAVSTLEAEGISPDVVIVDPPRKGCDQEVLDTIVRFSPKRLVIVSCNPATAARDCRLLEELGYRVDCYQPFDLFPRTGHVETVVLLSHIPDGQIDKPVELMQENEIM